MGRKLIAGNWKMHKTVAEAVATVEAFVLLVDRREDVDVVICPPYLSIPKLHELLLRTHIQIGAQDVFWLEKGAFTGNISSMMLSELGVTQCIVGHSETRGRFGKLEIPESTLEYFSETDETINLKIRALIFHSIAPILCVGETLAERENGKTDAVIFEQLAGALEGIDGTELENFSVAYEPVWAIGTGQVCESGEANRVCGVIHDWFAKNLQGADRVRVLYGGSVKASNSKELLGMAHIDGALVGGASLDAHEFAEIVMSA